MRIEYGDGYIFDYLDYYFSDTFRFRPLDKSQVITRFCDVPIELENNTNQPLKIVFEYKDTAYIDAPILAKVEYIIR